MVRSCRRGGRWAGRHREETDRGPWVTLRATGYLVYAINPLSSARYRERHSTSGAKSDAGDAHVLAAAVKLVARAHQSAVWERTRHQLRLRSALNGFFPVSVRAFPDLTALKALTLLDRAPDPQPHALKVCSYSAIAVPPAEAQGQTLRRAHGQTGPWRCKVAAWSGTAWYSSRGGRLYPVGGGRFGRAKDSGRSGL